MGPSGCHITLKAEGKEEEEEARKSLCPWAQGQLGAIPEAPNVQHLVGQTVTAGVSGRL